MSLASLAATAVRLGTLALAPSLLALSACQHIPPAPLDAAANAERLAARSLSAPAVADALARHDLAVATDNAWSLDQLTLAAWTLRTDLAFARAEVAAARSTTTVDGQRPNPTVATTTEKVLDSGVANPWVIGAALALTFESGGKRAIRQQRALANEQVAEWRFGEALWLARSEVRAALLDVAFTQALVALDRDEARVTRAFLAWVETRLARGAATTPERLAAAQAVNSSDSRHNLDEAAAAKAAATLATTIGVAPSELATAQLLLPQIAMLPMLTSNDVNAARDLALVNRLDVRRALAEYAIAEQDLRAAVAQQYPDLTFAPGYTTDQADHKITLGLGLPVPLFHDASAAIERAIAARALAAAKFDDVQSAALAAIDSAFAQYQASRNALATAEQAERNAADVGASLDRQLAAGGANRGELLAQQIAVAEIRRSALAARRTLLDALTALESGVERPLFPPSAIEPEGAMRELLVGPTP